MSSSESLRIAPVPKRNGPVGTVTEGRMGGLVVLLDKSVQTFPSSSSEWKSRISRAAFTDPSLSGTSVQSWLFRWECMAGSN